MEENKMLENLKKFLDETPDEEIRRIWNSGNYLDARGIKVKDLLRYTELSHAIQKVITKDVDKK